MRQLIRSLSAGVLLVPVILGGAVASAQDDTDPSADCGVCHEELVAAFALTAHALDRPNAPTCTNCHGDGTQHMDEGGDASLIQYPRGSDGAATCLECHGDVAHAFNGGAAHGRAEVWCFDCHVVHPEQPRAAALLVDADSTNLCATCHARQQRAFSRPFGHQLGRAGLECVSCHNPHGGPGERSTKVDRSGDPVCITCHADLRGPHVFPHVAGPMGSCLSCHQPHGSSNPHALTRSRVDQLCLECHSTIGGGTLGSQPPAFHDLRSPRFRDCTVCHVAIHGSNTSPGLLK
jgi:DmsE family decaheme c-type cytochrome